MDYNQYLEASRAEQKKSQKIWNRMLIGLGVGVAGLATYASGVKRGQDAVQDAYNAFLITQFRDRLHPQDFQRLQTLFANIGNGANIPEWAQQWDWA